MPVMTEVRPVSPDGLYVWDGTQWVPNTPAQSPVLDPSDGWPMTSKLPKKEAKLLEASLSAGEQVLGRLVGAYDQTLVATDRRVLILKHGAVTGTAFGSKATSYVYPLITAVEVRVGAVGCALELSAAGVVAPPQGVMTNASSPNAVTFTRKQVPDVQATANKIRERIGPTATAPPTVADPTDQLRRLAELRGAGVLTEEEFTAKKTEILARL